MALINPRANDNKDKDSIAFEDKQMFLSFSFLSIIEL